MLIFFPISTMFVCGVPVSACLKAKGFVGPNVFSAQPRTRALHATKKMATTWDDEAQQS